MYTYSKIDYPAATFSMDTQGVNRSGQLAVNLPEGWRVQPHIWLANGDKLELETLEEQSQVLDLNNNRMSVGTSRLLSDNRSSRATVWHGAKGSLLLSLGGTEEAAYAM